MYTLETLKNHPVFKNFIPLTEIPRPSYHEKKVSDYLLAWAKERNLEVIQDESLNIIIKKKASIGYEDKEPVIIQGHMDMVAEKSASSDHDFEKDPLKLRIVDGNLYATDTTLGADNGIAVAMAMAVLEDDSIAHPPLEVLVTTAEEVGMDGAMGLDGSMLKGTRLLNIDSEEEGIFFVSCAGGNVTKVSFTPDYEETEEVLYDIKIKGFRGGHSGMEIIKQRGNAIKILGRFLNYSGVTRIAEISGGAKHNAIAREASAAVIFADPDEAKNLSTQFTEILKNEYKDEEKIEITITERKEDGMKKVMDEKTSGNLISYMVIMPDGVQTMMMEMENMVESSLNVGVLEMDENGSVIFTHAIRSSLNSRKSEITEVIRKLADITGAKWETFSEYPEWQYEPESQLKDKVIEVYKEVTGKDAEIKAIHAGLECGILKEKLKDTEMISFGPDMWDVHTPNEHLSIESTERVWEFLKALLAAL